LSSSVQSKNVKIQTYRTIIYRTIIHTEQ
jgi:hypothetical protein